jgi:uncharacterized protein YjbI with pentapeptide repeats
MKIEIKCRFSGSVLFSHDCEGNKIRTTLEVAVSACANLDCARLDGAYLASANLAGAYLASANLAGACLAGANLAGANLAGANLAGANLAGANLDGANLAGANLAGANLDGGEILKGQRPILQIGPIGSRCAYFSVFLTDKGLRLRAGCFFGSREEFEEQLAETHDGNEHSKEYKAALAMIDCHAEIWTAKEGE